MNALDTFGFFSSMTLAVVSMTMLTRTIAQAQTPDYSNGEAMTKHYEGFRSKPYIDSRGVWTIGYGFNMESNRVKHLLPGSLYDYKKYGITRKQADRVFHILYRSAEFYAKEYAGNIFQWLTKAQQNILIDMAYNLGEDGLGEFKRMQSWLHCGNIELVQHEMRHSDWYKQVGRRARNHVKMVMVKEST